MSKALNLVKFATQVDALVLADLRSMAHADGRNVQTLVGEALATYIANRKQGFVRPEILQSLQTSTLTFGSVYKALTQQP